jgi:ArsR family transcriptional regulator
MALDETPQGGEEEEMDSASGGEGAGWAIGQSITLELDVALAIVGGRFLLRALSPEEAAFVRGVPQEWRAQWPLLLGEPRSAVSILEYAASVAGVLAESAYDRATLAIRELGVDEALARLGEPSKRLGLVARDDLPPAERLADLAVRLARGTYESLGFALTPGGDLDRALASELALLPRLLRGGDLHARFWHWLDRFYYEFYRPWRVTRASAVQALEKRAITALGAREKAGTPPEMSWLPAQSPLLRYPELHAAVREGRLSVLFWIEPFGLADAWLLQPGLVVVSFAEAGAVYEAFQATAADVANRARALSDPTRLTILRLIRSFGMANTEIADYLGLARPTVSVHAKILREAGLIHSRQEGREVRHEVVPSEVRRLFRDLELFLDLPG